MRFLSAEQVEALAEAAGNSSLLIYVLAYTGIRWGEAVAPRRGRCDLLRRRLQIVESMAEVSDHRFFGPTKTYQERQVGVAAFLAELLAAHLAILREDPEMLVFTSPSGQSLSNANFRNRVWLPALRDADLPGDLRIHDLRHTCASLLIAQGAHPKAIHHLGRSSITVTLDRYGHLFPNALDDLARGLDAQRAAAYPRPGKSETVIDLGEKRAKVASDEQLRKWRPAGLEPATNGL